MCTQATDHNPNADQAQNVAQSQRSIWSLPLGHRLKRPLGPHAIWRSNCLPISKLQPSAPSHLFTGDLWSQWEWEGVPLPGPMRSKDCKAKRSATHLSCTTTSAMPTRINEKPCQSRPSRSQWPPLLLVQQAWQYPIYDMSCCPASTQH